jgi:hypothetical protein
LHYLLHCTDVGHEDWLFSDVFSFVLKPVTLSAMGYILKPERPGVKPGVGRGMVAQAYVAAARGLKSARLARRPVPFICAQLTD